MNRGMGTSSRRDGRRSTRYLTVAFVAAALVTGAGGAGAFEIPTGSEDVKFRWDNTFRYTLADRVTGQKQAILANPNGDDGDRNFDVGIVSNRLDVLSETDLIYKKDYGVRLSGAGWYDQKYDSGHLDNTSVATSNHLVNGSPALGFNSYNRKYFAGPGGELLDAFVFAKFTLGDVPLNVKVGRHALYWGEALGLAGTVHGISYAQSPIDVGKGFAMPGVEAKELFRPLNSVSFQVQPTSTLSIAGQYFLEWESNKWPEAGTYLGMSDVYLNGSESLIAGPGQRAVRGTDITPNWTRDWGLSARWSPEWLAGTLGFYYRNFSDKLPQVHVRPGVATLPVATGTALGYQMLGAPNAAGQAPFQINPAAAGIPDIMKGNIGQYHMAYVQNIDLFGISLSKQFFGVSVGAELSYRRNMPLLSDPVMILPAPLAAATSGAISDLPGQGQTGGARGNTWHGVLNFLGTISETPLFNTASWNMEYVWNRLDTINSGAAVYKGRAGYNLIDKPTKDFVGGAVSFTPTWYQVFPGVDLSMPLNINSGLIGNSAINLGGNKNGGSYSFGLSADILQQYKVDLKYTDYFGDFGPDASGAMTVANGGYAMLSDRGTITLTMKATF